MCVLKIFYKLLMFIVVSISTIFFSSIIFITFLHKMKIFMHKINDSNFTIFFYYIFVVLFYLIFINIILIFLSHTLKKFNIVVVENILNFCNLTVFDIILAITAIIVVIIF